MTPRSVADHATVRLRSVVIWMLMILTVFQVLSAVIGGIGVLATDGLGMPASLLGDGPFDTFVLPGVILLIVVGGTQTVALGLLLMRRETALLWTAVAAFGMLIWIFVETGMVRGTSWLQVIYFSTGGAQLVLVLALLGIVRWFPRAPMLAPVRIVPGTTSGGPRA